MHFHNTATAQVHIQQITLAQTRNTEPTKRTRTLRNHMVRSRITDDPNHRLRRSKTIHDAWNHQQNRRLTDSMLIRNVGNHQNHRLTGSTMIRKAGNHQNHQLTGSALVRKAGNHQNHQPTRAMTVRQDSSPIGYIMKGSRRELNSHEFMSSSLPYSSSIGQGVSPDSRR